MIMGRFAKSFKRPGTDSERLRISKLNTILSLSKSQLFKANYKAKSQPIMLVKLKSKSFKYIAVSLKTSNSALKYKRTIFYDKWRTGV
jgi:hypothetical protein